MFKRKLVFIIGLALILITAKNVNATTIQYICEYNYNDQLSGSNSNSEVMFYTNDSTPRIRINSFNDKYIRKKLFSSTAVDYKIENWNDLKSTFADTTNCPNYALIYYFVGKNNAITTKTWLSNNKNYLEDIIKDNSWWNETSYHIATCKSFGGTEEEKQQYYETVVNYTNHINESYQSYSTSSCIDNSSVVNRITKCKSLYNALETYMNSSEKEVSNWIKSGFISNDDQRTKNYYSALENARKKWEEVKKELNEEQKKIDEETNVPSKPDDEENKNPSEPSQKPNDKEKNPDVKNLSTTKMCQSENLRKTLKYIGWVVTFIKIIVPLLIIGLGAVDFFKALTSSKIEDINKPAKSLAMRLICGIVIFFIPTIIHLFFSLIDDWNDYDTAYSNCTECLWKPKSC